MTVEDVSAAAVLVVLSGTLLLLAVATYRRYRNPSFIFLVAAFILAFAEGLVITLLAFGLLPGAGMPLFLVAGIQAAILLLIYVATFLRE